MHAKYCIVGGGYASAGAIDGIRARDRDGGIVLFSRENHRPYARPMLTKDLWDGSGTLDQLPLRTDDWYREHKVDVRLRHEIIEIDAEEKKLWNGLGDVITFDELLLATG